MNIIDKLDKNETISVIIPVYNVDKYIVEALDSVCNQTYENLEIIIIDDGSTDNSAEICDEYALNDSRIIVIHQSNAGAAAAKNAGLKIATGKYLAFLDSDDYLELDAYEYMLSQINYMNADVIQCSFRDFYKNEKIDRVSLNEECLFDNIEYLRRFTSDWTCGLLWDKLYRRDLFEGILFEEGHKIDDEFFTYKGIMNASKIIHMPKVVYNYRKRKSSVMLSDDSKEKIIYDKIDYLSSRRHCIAKRFPILKEIYDLHYLNMLVILCKDPDVSIEQIKMIKKCLHEYFKSGDITRLNKALCWELIKLLVLPTSSLARKSKSNFVKCKQSEEKHVYFE